MALLDERRPPILPFGQKAEALEDSTISKPIGVLDQLCIAAIGPPEIGIQAIRNLLDAAANGWVIEHVDNGPVDIGDRHFALMAPDRLGTEDFLGFQVLERKIKAVPLLLSDADGLAGDHDDILENLFREIPMLGGRAAADIGRREQRRHEDPRIIEYTFRAERNERSRYISAPPDPAQPTLLPPARKSLGCFYSRGAKHVCHIGDLDNVA